MGAGAAASCVQVLLPGEDVNSTYYKIMGPSYQCNCKAWSGYGACQWIAALIFVFFSIGFPAGALALIRRNTPRGSTEDPHYRYNDDGERVPYTDDLYRKDLQTDPRQLANPYMTLYDGFERKGRYYKVWSMLLKAALVIPAVVLAEKTVPQVTICLVAMALFTIYASVSRAFLDPVADVMDIAGRIAAFATALFGLISSAAVAPGTSTVMAILINIVNALSFTLMTVCFLMGIRAVRNCCKRCGVSALEFSNTTSGLVGNAYEIVDRGGWDLRLETKHRIWWLFWDSLLNYVPPAAGANGAGPAQQRVITVTPVRMPDGSVVMKQISPAAAPAGGPSSIAAVAPAPATGDEEEDEAEKKRPAPQLGKGLLRRHEELKSIVRDQGRVRMVEHFAALAVPGRWSLRHYIAWNLEGPDVYWDGPVQDSSAEHGGTKWGRLYSIPCPFRCVHVQDEGGGYAFITERQLDSLVSSNQSPEIERQRGIRRQLRAMNGRNAAFHFERDETFRVEDGEETYVEDGRQKRRTRYSRVTVHMVYEHGTLHVGTKREGIASEGFTVSLSMTARGIATAPHTGQRKEVVGSVSLGHEALGIEPRYPMTPNLERLLRGNAHVIAAGAPEVANLLYSYRSGLNAKRAATEEVLSHAWWLHVYDADTLPRPALEAYLRNCERNPVLRALPETHKAALDYLYGRMNFARSHPVCSLWFVFFDDVWRCNQHIKAITAEENKALMNPALPTALAYKPMQRAALETVLGEHKLLGRWGLFNKRVLDALYRKLDAVDAGFIREVEAARAARASGGDHHHAASNAKPTLVMVGTGAVGGHHLPAATPGGGAAYQALSPALVAQLSGAQVTIANGGHQYQVLPSGSPAPGASPVAGATYNPGAFARNGTPAGAGSGV